MRVAVIALLSFTVAACAVDAPPRGVSDGIGPHVSVRGEAHVEVAPDRLTVRARVTQLADDVEEATRIVNQRTAAALDAARNAGVADRDLRALSVTVQPMWDWVENRRVFRGHEASRQLEVIVRDVELWPDVLSALIRARVDRIDSVEADHSRRDELTRQALQDAVRDARARADLLADAAGARVDGVYSVSEQSRGWVQPRPPTMAAMRMEAADVAPPEAFEAGVIRISSEVEAVFTLRGRRR